MSRWFNIAGPCRPAHHYTLPVTRRLPRVRRLIDHQAYFVLHAPRQVGKTTALDALAHELTAEGRYAAALLSMEVGAAFPGDPGAAELAILSAWRGAAEARLPPELQPPAWPAEPPAPASSPPSPRGHAPARAPSSSSSTRPTPSPAPPSSRSLAQLDRYLDGLALDTGWLVVFDRRAGQPRIAQRTQSEPVTTPSGRHVTLIRA